MHILFGPFDIECACLFVDFDLRSVELSDRGVAAHEFGFMGGEPLSVFGLWHWLFVILGGEVSKPLITLSRLGHWHAGCFGGFLPR